MKLQECQIGKSVVINNTFYQWNHNALFALPPEGIISGLREEITFEKGRKQYTVEFGKRKAIYSQIKIVSRYATVILIDGIKIDVNIEDLTAKSCGGP